MLEGSASLDRELLLAQILGEIEHWYLRWRGTDPPGDPQASGLRAVADMRVESLPTGLARLVELGRALAILRAARTREVLALVGLVVSNVALYMALLYLLCDVGLYVVIVLFVALFDLTKTQGFVKLIRRKDGPVIGVHMVGDRVGELIGEAQLVYNWEGYAEDVAPLVHAHPTQNEALGEAHLALAGKPLHAHN